MRQKLIVKILLVIIATLVFGVIIGSFNKVNAIEIDENRYPGYKSLLDNIERMHPNWNIKLLYTGLNWDDVISEEYTGHGESPKSLSYYTYKGEWICPICGEKTYDVSQKWHCASRKAIAYMMDPRNSLSEEWIFQFQNLGSASGERIEIEKMVKGTFLSDPSCVTAIMEAAQAYQISPFHLVSRIIQEQGTSGVGSMNGYVYTTENENKVVVYNLYNIRVSGNDATTGFLAGAKFAYEQKWFTREESIKGGAKFLRESYIDRGQNTLYFQKYNVVNKSNLYAHQYMQNIRAANDEGNKIYQNYRNLGVLNSHFEFIIPVYENMPSGVCERPSDNTANYSADIGTEVIHTEIIKNIHGNWYISGEIYISEFIDGKTWNIPRILPIMRLKTTSGEYINSIYIKKIEGNKYYFDFKIEDLDANKKYIIEVELGDSENISKHKVGIADFNKNINIGKYKRSEITIVNDQIAFIPVSYSGDIGTGLLEFNMSKNNEGKAYVYGNVVINEWIDGTGNIPDIIPSIKIKAIDGSVEYDCWVINTKENQYYFDSYIEGIDVEKEYEIEATLQNTYNVSKYIKANILEDQEKKLGKYDESIVWIKNGKMVFELDTYQGDIGNEIKDIYLNKNREGKYYISGNVYVTEWINGTIWSVPSKTPKITIKTREGKEAYEAWVSKVTGNEYYFDSYIEDIDVSKEYVIEIELVGKANVSKNKIGRAYFVKDMKLGKYKGKEMKVQNSIISFEGDEYRGDIGQQLDWIQVNQSSVGKTYINGNIYITEWIEGKEWSEPRELPKIRIKTVEGEEVYNAWVSNIGGNKYYFDSYIEGIDTTREYVIEVELASKNNISNYKKGNVVFGTTEKSIGEYKEKKIIVERDRIRFEGVIYNGDLGQQLDWIQLNQNNEGKTYINGNIYITEWINGIKWSIPEGTPKIKIRTVEGEEVYNAWVSNIGENKYYFDSYIEEIDVSKEYEIEIELSNPNNLSTNKKGKVDFGRQRKLGEYREYEVQIQDSKIKFIKLKSEKKQEIKEEPQEAEKSEVIEESLEEVNKSKVEEELKETTEKKESVEEEKNEIEEEERIELEEVLEQEEKTEISK